MLILLLSALASAGVAQGFVDAEGRAVKLTTYTRAGPAAVVVMKGTWCGVCVAQLRRLEAQRSALKAIGAEVVGLHSEPPAASRKLKGLSLPILSARSPGWLRTQNLWLERLGFPMPGIVFLDRCGQISEVVRGRRPGQDQTKLILRTLERLAKAPAGCTRA